MTPDWRALLRRAFLDHRVVIDVSPMHTYNRVAEDATAFAHRDERFLLEPAVVITDDFSAPVPSQES